MFGVHVFKAASVQVLYLLPSSWEAPVFWITVWVLGALVVVLFALVGWALVLRLLRQRKQRRQRRLEARWQPCLDRILAGQAPPQELHQAVHPNEEAHLVSFLHRRAPDVNDEDLKVLRVLARPYLEIPYDVATQGTPEQRAYQVHRIGWLGGAEADSVLRQALEGPSPFVAMVAARALIRRCPASAVEREERARLIVGALPRFKNWSRKSLAALLARLEGAPAPLRQTYADPEADLRVRLIAAAALRELDDADAAPLAVRILQDEKSPLELLTASLRLLEKVGRSADGPFMRALSYTENEVIRIRALSALAHIGRPTDADRFEEALDDPSRWVARQAAMGLVRLGRPDALFALIETDHPRASLAHQVLTHHRIAA